MFSGIYSSRIMAKYTKRQRFVVQSSEFVAYTPLWECPIHEGVTEVEGFIPNKLHPIRLYSSDGLRPWISYCLRLDRSAMCQKTSNVETSRSRDSHNTRLDALRIFSLSFFLLFFCFETGFEFHVKVSMAWEQDTRIIRYWNSRDAFPKKRRWSGWMTHRASVFEMDRILLQCWRESELV